MLQAPEYFRTRKGYEFEIVQMSPAEYMLKASDILDGDVEDVVRSRDKKISQEYAQKMMDGEKFPMPVLDYSRNGGQEGLHRAIAASLIGLSRIPVMVVHDAVRPEGV